MRKEVDPARLEELAASGANIKTICAEFGISDPTLYQRLKKEPELKGAYERGRARAKASKSAVVELEPQDQDVLDAVEAAGKNGATMHSILRVDLVRGMAEAEVDGSLRKLTALGRIHVKLEGVNRTETFYLGKGQSQTNGATRMATKKRASKKSSKRRQPKSVLSDGEKVSLVGRAVDATETNGSPAHAIGAALVELTYIRQWGKPSPMCDEVIGMLASFRPQAVAQ
jgi:transposase-like protein